MVQVYYWLALLGILTIALFLLVPLDRIRQLFVFGLIGGVGLAVVVFTLASLLNVWTTIGGIKLFGYIPILPSIAWFFPTVMFGNFFPKSDSWVVRGGWILLFALGSVVLQYVFDVLGMWRSIHWNLFYTFLLAVTTHTLLTFYMMNTEQYLPEQQG